jgi:hypothetical protein
MGRARSTHRAKTNAYRILVGNQKERDHSEDQDNG